MSTMDKFQVGYAILMKYKWPMVNVISMLSMPNDLPFQLIGQVIDWSDHWSILHDVYDHILPQIYPC